MRRIDPSKTILADAFTTSLQHLNSSAPTKFSLLQRSHLHLKEHDLCLAMTKIEDGLSLNAANVHM